jgi:L-threonylcarbamoyladenylate synthase
MVGGAPVPRVLVVDARVPDPEAVAEAVRVLRSGGLVAMPTETVYGLAARAFDEHAVARIYAVKGRPAHHPLIAHVATGAEARALAASWPEPAARLAAAFWPGPLTVVVDRASHVPASVAGGGSSIALRAPAHPVALALLFALGEPVAAPSANRFQGLSPTTAAHVVKELGDGVDLVLDAGPCDAGIESTVVDLRSSPPRVLRPGALDLATLRGILPDVEGAFQSVRGEGARVSPGMEARHYAPRARLRLAGTRAETLRIARALAETGARVAMVTHERAEWSEKKKEKEKEEREEKDETAGHDSPRGEHPVLARSLPDDPTKYARLLYGMLHDLDDAGADVIVVQGVPDDEAWWAVADRLRRGSTE